MSHRTSRPAATSERPPSEIPADVLEVLALPALPGLAEDLATGRTCVWGGEHLTIETAIDLGEQLGQDSGRTVGERWFPRACRACLAERAHRGLFAHTPTCRLCRDEETAADCAVGRGLYRIVRDCRR